MLMNRLGPFYAKYLILLILGVAPFASAQDSKLPPDVRISEASKLDKPQAGYYRMKIGKIEVIAPYRWNYQRRLSPDSDKYKTR